MTEKALPNFALINFTDTEVIKLPASIYKEAKSYLSYKDIKKFKKLIHLLFMLIKDKKEKTEQTI